jgi:hypothetical protein
MRARIQKLERQVLSLSSELGWAREQLSASREANRLRQCESEDGDEP